MPAYNYERFVARAIESALAQNYAADRLEIIVVDDGSEDGTPDSVRPYLDRVRTLADGVGLCSAAIGPPALWSPGSPDRRAGGRLAPARGDPAPHGSDGGPGMNGAVAATQDRPNPLADKVILMTGGTGSFGQVMLRRLLGSHVSRVPARGARLRARVRADAPGGRAFSPSRRARGRASLPADACLLHRVRARAGAAGRRRGHLLP